MTTAGFVSGAREDDAPTRCSRVAASAALLMGVALLAILPAASEAAFYVAVLAAASAAVTIVGGSVLWSRASLVARSVVALAALATLVAQLLQVFVGLPGAADLGELTRLESAAALGLPAAVLVLLLADALRRGPQQAPDRPYAL